MIIIPRRKQKVKYSRKLACKFLEPKGDISHANQALCYCVERELVLGTRAYVCQVCALYTQANKKISDVYDESKRIAEKKIKEREIEIEEFELDEIDEDSDDLDLTIDEFEEDETEIPLKFEKRKGVKAGSEDEEGFGDLIECPFCAELFDDLTAHIQECEFAPDDVSLDDITPSRPKKRKKRKTRSTSSASGKKSEPAGDKQKCPYCGKEFIRLGRHLNSCKKRPADAETESEED